VLHAPPAACFWAVSPLLKVNVRTKLLITGTAIVVCDHCKTLAAFEQKSQHYIETRRPLMVARSTSSPSVNEFITGIPLLTKTSFGILPFNLLVSLPVTPNASFSSNASHASCLHHEASQLRRFVPASHCGGQGQYKLHF
jgi:hypothetical protein